MDSNSIPSGTTSDHNHHHRRLHHFTPPAQSFSDRIIRAVRHRLRLLHRVDSLFFILGATGNVYTVNIGTDSLFFILFVFICVLALPLDDSCLWRRTLRPCQIHRLLSLPTSGESLAGFAVRERFHQLFFETSSSRQMEAAAAVEGDAAVACPVCLEEIRKEEKAVGTQYRRIRI